MSKKLIYTDIKAQILANTGVKTCRLWNNQIDKLDRENAFAFPAAFVEFNELTFENTSGGSQEITGSVKIHIVQEELRTENDWTLDFVDSIAKALNGFKSDTILTPLLRISEIQDIDHDQLIIWEQDYQLTAKDDTSSKYVDAVEIAGGSVEICIEDTDQKPVLIIDNPVIRTGSID